MAKEPYHTIPVRRTTWERFKAYRMGGASYDEVLTELMDLVPLDQYAQKYLARQRGERPPREKS